MNNPVPGIYTKIFSQKISVVRKLAKIEEMKRQLEQEGRKTAGSRKGAGREQEDKPTTINTPRKFLYIYDT